MPYLSEKDKNSGQLNLLVAIYKISHNINSTIGLDQCLKAILDTTTDLLEVEMASIMLINRAKNELSIRYACGLSEKIIKEARSILGQKDPKEVAAWVAQRGEPLLIEDIEKDGRFLKRGGDKYSTNSLLSVPLKVKDEVIGVINVNNKKLGGVFTQQDLDILMTLANEVAIAIQNNRLYEELLSANERLKELDQLKSDFVASVSHELNTPLATSKYLLSIVEKGIAGNVTPKQKEYLGLIQNNIDRLTRLIDNLLNLSRIESGRFELRREQLDIAGLIKEAIEPFKASAQAKTVSLKAAIASRLPKVYIDKDRAMQVLTNLLDNAIKFTPEGGRIVISAEIFKPQPSFLNAGLDFVQVCVSDSGAGISPEDIDKLFVKFQRVSNKLQGEKIKGTGLGLAITKEIVDAHSGKIWIESELGAGSKFFFTMPVYNEEYFFKEYFIKQISKASDAKTNVSLLAFDLAGIMGLKERLSHEQLISVLDEICKLAKNNIRRPVDLVTEFKNEGRILVIAEVDRAGSAVLIDRVVKDVKLHKIKDKSGRQVNVAVRAVSLTFPEDGVTAEELIDKLYTALEKNNGK